MHYFEDEFKARFKEETSREGVEEEVLWQEISKGLILEQESDRSHKKRTWWLFPLILCISSLSGDWHTEAGVPTVAAIAFSESSELLVENPKSILESSNESILAGSVEGGNVITTEEEIAVVASEDFLDPSSIISHEAERFSPPSVNNAAADKLNEDSIEGHSVEVSNRTIVDLDNRNSYLITKSVAAFLYPLELKKWDIHSIITATPVSAELIDSKEGVEFGAQIGVFRQAEQFGENEELPNYNNVLAGAHSDGTGLRAQVFARIPVGKNLSLITGLGYSEAYSTFDLTQTRDTVMFRDNIPGSELIDAIATRRVKHQRKLSWLSVPLLVGVHSSNDKLQIGFNTGIGLNYMLQQSGRSVNAADEFITYGDAGNESLPFNRFFLSAQLQFSLGYRFSDYFRLDISPSFSYQMHGESPVHNLRHSTTLMGLSVGLVYKL